VILPGNAVNSEFFMKNGDCITFLVISGVGRAVKHLGENYPIGGTCFKKWTNRRTGFQKWVFRRIGVHRWQILSPNIIYNGRKHRSSHTQM
jgi:hypothetical protein